jgi:hypothetical protein
VKPTYEQLVEALGKAIEIYQYASMTAYERDAFQEDFPRIKKLYEEARNETR